MSTERTQTIAPAVASATSVHAAVTLLSAAQTVTAGITSPDVYRALSVKGNQASVTGNVTITGTDWNGATVSDTIAASGASTVLGVKAVKTVTSILLPALASAGDTISIGWADKFGLYGDVTASGDLILTERAASGAVEFTIEANGTLNTSYNTVTATIVAGDRMRWTYLDSGYVTSGGTTLFTVAEARAFDKAQLASATTYTDAAILAAESRIREDFYAICAVQFVPTSKTEWQDGDGSNSLILREQEVQSVESCLIYDSTMTLSETLDAAALADLAVEEWGSVTRRSHGYFLRGHKNVCITYTHGYATTPAAIKYAALRLLVWQLVPNNVDQRMTALTADGHTWSMAVAGRTNQWYGLPEVDSALQRYNHTMPSIG
jgi:hypothetical protein